MYFEHELNIAKLYYATYGFEVNFHSVPECQGTFCSKQTLYLKVK